MAKPQVIVTVRDNNIDRALKFFKKKVMESGHIALYKEKQEFVSKSAERRERKKKAVYNQMLDSNRDKTTNV